MNTSLLAKTPAKTEFSAPINPLFSGERGRNRTYNLVIKSRILRGTGGVGSGVKRCNCVSGNRGYARITTHVAGFLAKTAQRQQRRGR